MNKAFLSHNGADKDFVENVAKKLSRAQIIFDKYVFYEAEDFRDSIQKGLKNSSLFVLFASKESLNASWVKYELNEAELLLIEGKIKKVLVFLIGNDISHSDLPKWCQKALVIPASSPGITTRIIEENLLKINPSYQEIYLGRGTDLDKFSQHLFKITKAVPQVLVFYGLQGIGRRSFAREALEKAYNLRLGPIFETDATESLLELYIKILDDTDEISTKKELSDYIEVFKEANLDQQTEEITRLLRKYSDYKIAPCILDNGGLLDQYGRYKAEYKLLMEKVNKTKNLHLIILQTRNPNYHENEQFFFVTYLNALSEEGMNALLSAYLRNMDISFNNTQIREFTSYLDGYPPAAQFVRNYIKKYGIDMAIADKRLLNDFKASSFTEYLDLMVEDNKLKINILRICESFPPLIFNVLKILNENEDFTEYFRELIDQSIIVFEQENNKYTLSTPLREAVRRKWGSLNKKEYSDIAHKLKTNYWNGKTLPENSILETLIFCLLRSGNEDELESFTEIILPSTILKAAKSFYINREWSMAIDLSKKAISLNDNLDEARVILFKSLVRENENSDHVLNELRYRKYRSYHALKGFRDLKKRSYAEAIKSYNLAIATGDESPVVYREIAECFYWLGDYTSATKYINIVIDRNKKPNPFVLDLAAKISIESRDFDKAKEHIAQLELVDRPENVSHRKALLYSKQGEYIEAIKYAEEACKRQPPLPETFLNKTHILIMLEKYNDARNVLSDIKNNFKSQTKKDFFIELQCRIALETLNHEEAEIYYNKISNKHSDYSKVLYFKLLKLKSTDESISLKERTKLNEELTKLEDQGVIALMKDGDLSFKEESNI